MAFITRNFDPNGLVIEQGFKFFGNSTDLVINYTTGLYRYEETRLRCNSGGALTVEPPAPASGKVRLDIIEIGSTADDVPTIKKGTEVVTDPEYPTVSADHVRIAAIGTVTNPIEDDTTKVVYTTPGPGEVELQDETMSFRL